ncbi:MAG: hypothetical protein N3B12_06350 [Armatimonadetes bacterium]|nr:hypothetical protein [Armatimonadota bacterium]
MEKSCLWAIAFVAILVCAGEPLFGQACPAAPVKPSTITLEVAPGGSILNKGPLINASGGVFLASGRYKIRASEALFDARLRTGALRDVEFTTCDKLNPDYRFSARELSLLPLNRIHAKRASLFLGKVKVVTLPSVKIAVGRKGYSTDTFPRPGFDENEGFGLAQKLALVDTDRLQLNADVRLTVKRGLEGELDDTWGIDGDLVSLPGRFLTYESLRSSALTMPRTFGRRGCEQQSAGLSFEDGQEVNTGDGRIARLRQFARFSVKQRTYDIRNTGLLVYRQPEIGLSYTAPSLNLTRTCLDSRLEMYPTISVSWGQFREAPGSASLTRRTLIGVVAGVNIVPLGPCTAIQPVVAYTAAAYQGGMFYRTSTYAIDASHILPDGSIASLRYIKRDESGASPFLFDTINIVREFQGAFQARVGSQVVGFVAGYDASTRKIYDWQALLGHHTDCLAFWFTWDNLLKRLSFDVALINL